MWGMSREGEPLPVRVRERGLGGGAAGGGGAHGAAGAGARDQLRARRNEPPRLARARRRPLRLVARLRRVLLRRAAQPQRTVRFTISPAIPTLFLQVRCFCCCGYFFLVSVLSLLIGT